MRGMREREAHIGDAELAQAPAGLLDAIAHRLQRRGEGDEARLGDSGQERFLVGEVPVGRRLGDARAPRHLAQREALRPALDDERLRRAQQRRGEVAAPPRPRCRPRAPPPRRPPHDSFALRAAAGIAVDSATLTALNIL